MQILPAFMNTDHVEVELPAEVFDYQKMSPIWGLGSMIGRYMIAAVQNLSNMIEQDGKLLGTLHQLDNSNVWWRVNNAAPVPINNIPRKAYYINAKSDCGAEQSLRATLTDNHCGDVVWNRDDPLVRTVKMRLHGVKSNGAIRYEQLRSKGWIDEFDGLYSFEDLADLLKSRDQAQAQRAFYIMFKEAEALRDIRNNQEKFGREFKNDGFVYRYRKLDDGRNGFEFVDTHNGAGYEVETDADDNIVVVNRMEADDERVISAIPKPLLKNSTLNNSPVELTMIRDRELVRAAEQPAARPLSDVDRMLVPDRSDEGDDAFARLRLSAASAAESAVAVQESTKASGDGGQKKQDGALDANGYLTYKLKPIK